jgi:hypothetical protein
MSEAVDRILRGLMYLRSGRLRDQLHLDHYHSWLDRRKLGGKRDRWFDKAPQKTICQARRHGCHISQIMVKVMYYLY